MIVPVVISFLTFDLDKWFLFFPYTEEKGMMPDLTCALLSVSFYLALIVRYGIFRKDNLVEGIISTIRTLLDCWAMAALISPIVAADNAEVKVLYIFRFNSVTILLIAVILSWVGVKSIAGFCWILYVIVAFSCWGDVAEAMGGAGALFVITFAASMFLQIQNFSNVKDFFRELRGSSSRYSGQIKGDMKSAIDDVKGKVHRGGVKLDQGKDLVKESSKKDNNI